MDFSHVEDPWLDGCSKLETSHSDTGKPDQVPGNQDTTLQSVFSANWVSLEVLQVLSAKVCR